MKTLPRCDRAGAEQAAALQIPPGSAPPHLGARGQRFLGSQHFRPTPTKGHPVLRPSAIARRFAVRSGPATLSRTLSPTRQIWPSPSWR